LAFSFLPRWWVSEEQLLGIEFQAEMADRLTQKQQRLGNDLGEIARIVRVDYWNILERERAARTPVLEVMKRELIRGEVVGQYTLIDDLLSRPSSLPNERSANLSMGPCLFVANGSSQQSFGGWPGSAFTHIS